MKNKLFSFLVVVFFSFSCLGQQASNKFPVGKWIVVTEQTTFVKSGKVLREFPLEKVAPEDAYIYNFTSANTVSVTNISTEFDWEFKIKLIKDQIELLNINGDAEDDKLLFSYQKDNLILKRIMEDLDPDDESSVIDVVTTMILRKI